jgi:hypothetical protein
MLRFIVFAMALAPGLALAQPAPPAPAAPKAPPSRQAIDGFVEAFATPTHATGKLARWETGICPATSGQASKVSAFVTDHLMAVAGAVGAPVNVEKSCTANIDIIFTTSPQALLDNVRERNTDFIGYAPGGDELRKLATVTHPIQAWYSTETRDLRGQTHIDTGRDRGDREQAATARATGTRLTNGLRSAFHHVLNVVDPSKLEGQEVVPLSDYIAMLALSQPGSLDACLDPPSIVNMFAKGCASKPAHITESDMAYLHGLYGMNADRIMLSSQKNDIAAQMVQSLSAR